MESCPQGTPTQKPKLLEQVREVLRGQQYALNTEECYIDWIRRFILFHQKRHPREMGKIEVELFLTHLAAERDVSISTQRQAMNALLFLYQKVLKIELGWLDAVRAKRLPRLPVVMSREEVRLLLAEVEGAEGLYRMLAELLYGTGMRIDECCSSANRGGVGDIQSSFYGGGLGTYKVLFRSQKLLPTPQAPRSPASVTISWRRNVANVRC
jgi:site-specific recombinase XerD